MGRSILQIEFEGVSAIVPDVPFFRRAWWGCWVPGKTREVSVLIPDLTLPEVASWSRGVPAAKLYAVRAPHLPLAIFEMSSYDKANSSCPPDLIVRPSWSRDELGVIFLDHFHIVLGDTYDTSGGLTFDSGVHPGKYPQQGQEKSLWWLPRMSVVSRGDSLAKEGFDFKTYPALDVEEFNLSAASRFSYGHLSCAGFNRRVDRSYNEWGFFGIRWDQDQGAYLPIGTPTWERAIGNQLSIEVAVKEKFARIEFWKEDIKQSDICLLPSCITGIAALKIVNVESEVALSLAREPLLGIGGISPGDPDFEALYRLSSSCTTPGLDPRRQYRVPVRLDERGHPIGDSARPCSPVVMDGFGRI